MKCVKRFLIRSAINFVAIHFEENLEYLTGRNNDLYIINIVIF